MVTYEFTGTNINQWGTVNLWKQIANKTDLTNLESAIRADIEYQPDSLLPIKTGVNKFNKNSKNIFVGYFNTAGSILNNPSYRISHYIYCKNESFTSVNAGSSNSAIVFYDTNFTILSTLYQNGSPKIEGASIPIEAVYLRFHYSINAVDSVMCQFSSKLSVFKPYNPLYKLIDSSMIVSSSLNVTNLSKDTFNNLLLNSDKVITNIFDAGLSTDYGTGNILNSGYIPINKSGTYATNIKFHVGGAKYFKVFDRDYNEIADFTVVDENSITIPEVNGIAYIYFRYYYKENSYIINRFPYYSNYENYIPYGEFYTLDKTLLNQFESLIGTVTKDNTLCFDASKNLIDLRKLTYGFAFDGINLSYNTTDFIDVSSFIGRTLYYTNNGAAKPMRQFYFYDLDKKVIGEIYNNIPSIEVPNNAAYFRQAISVQDNYPQLEVDSITSYRKYGPVLREEALPDSVPTEPFGVFLPDTLYVGNESIIEIYNIQIAKCGNINNFHFYWKGDIITTPQYFNKVRINPKGRQPGIYTVELEVTNNNNVTVYLKKMTVTIVDNLISGINTPYTIIPFGDSGVNKPWLPETRNLLQKTTGYDTLHWLGNLPYWSQVTEGAQYCNNIGKSGWQQSQFLNEGSYGNIKFKITSEIVAPPVFNKRYEVELTNGTKILYKIDEVLKENNVTYLTMSVVTWTSILVTIGPISSGTLKSSDSLSGDALIPYESFENIGGNPFWNPVTKAIDFNYYFSKYSITEPDAFMMHLGANSISDTASIESLIDIIQSQMPNKRIYVNSVWMFGDISFNIKRRITFLNFIETVYEICKRKSNVYFIPIYATIDAEHNFGWIEEDVNPRNNRYKLMRPNEIVHYQEAGYYQLADTVYSTLLATISK